MDARPTMRAPGADRFWLIVPYDAIGMGQLLDSKTLSGNGDQSSILDKAFQTHFRVPSPAIKSWKDFTLDTLQTAMPDHDADEVLETYRVMRREYLRNGAHSLPSPRTVKLDVNRIGSLHRQWCDQIPLPMIGQYVVQFERRWEKTSFAP